MGGSISNSFYIENKWLILENDKTHCSADIGKHENNRHTIMNQEKGFIIKLGDIATLLTISSILLYYLGWNYWCSFFNSLNIDSSFIEMTIDRLISSTWYFILFVILGFHMTYYYLLIVYQEKKINIIYALTNLIISLLFLLWFSMRINPFLYLSLGFSTVIVSMIITKVLRKKNIPPPQISMRLFIYILTAVIYTTSIFYYKELGEKHADEYKTDYNENIELLRINNNSLIKGKLVAYMKNKYFLLKKENGADVIYIFNDSEILQTKMLD